MANLNTPLRRFESGGELTIGADVIKNIEPGSFRYNIPIRQRLEYTDRGTQQVPLEGDDQLCDISFTCKLGVEVTNGIINAFTVASTDNLAKTYAVAAKVPAFKNATTGESFSWAAAWLADLPQVERGVAFDTVTFNLKSTTGPTVAAYS